MPIQDLTCDHCSVPFRARQRTDKPRRYCSRGCRDAARTTRVTLECVQCHQPFERKAYQADWSTERGPFCSMPCYGAWQLVDRDAYSSTHHKNQRELAVVRDGRRCVECGVGTTLQVHHVVPWQAGQVDPHALDNLVTLCALHHHAAHKALGTR